ncbi:MAG: thioredoxin domain-containing protein, partial [Desulfobacterales bacterium]
VAHGRQTAKNRIWAIAFLISMAFSLYSCILAYISSYYIQSYCIVCIATYAVNFLLAYFTWLIRKRFDSQNMINALKEDFQYIAQKRKQILVLGGIFFAISISLIVYFPDYWNLRLSHHSSQLHTGVTEDGHPYIGADSPEIVITEYTDYLCFQCRKMHSYLRELIERHPDKIRLVHRHFPMDHKFNPIVKTSFHEGSGMMALVALYSEKFGKFWQANDYFFSIAGQAQEINLHQMAGKLGLNVKGLTGALSDRTTRRQLRSDILQGLKIGVTGTPTYVINGKVYHATIPPEILKKVLD